MAVEKKFVLSCSEKVFGTAGGTPLIYPASLVTPITLSNDPTAKDIAPDAEASLPFPT
jgi:hypothetical protein